MADKKASKGRSRRRVKKNVTYGQAHIKTSFNNTIVTLTDTDGNVIAWESAGSAGFKGSRKSTPFAAQVTADAAAKKGMEHGLERVEVFAKGAGSGRKQCRREGQKLFLKGERCFTDKCGVERRSYPPGEHGRGRLRQSEYRLQLREKQKTRRYYQVLEKQFRAYYEKASRQDGVTGENLLRLLESRFDNVLVRLGFAASRRQARQLITHGHWMINGRRVDIPSYQVKPEEIISIKSGSGATETIQRATELVSTVPAWLQADHDALTAKVLRLPERSEISAPVQEQLIVELYSK
jgi:small subunit ribosomal protein S4